MFRKVCIFLICINIVSISVFSLYVISNILREYKTRDESDTVEEVVEVKQSGPKGIILHIKDNNEFTAELIQ